MKQSLQLAWRVAVPAIATIAAALTLPPSVAQADDGENCTVNGEPAKGPEDVIGTDGPDTIVCENLKYRKIDAKGGNDSITIKDELVIMPAGEQTGIHGGNGTDTIKVKSMLSFSTAEPAEDPFISGGDDSDRIHVDSIREGTVGGDDGDDEITIARASRFRVVERAPQVYGHSGSDTIRVDKSTAVGMLVSGGTGSDDITVEDMSSGDRIQGDEGNDSFKADIVSFGGRIDGGSGDDHIHGFSFGKVIVVPQGVVDGNEGSDTCETLHLGGEIHSCEK
ncbi:hypothetical protein [Salininema proteolyticum]|uniref:Uncharacterized protein n=1 Tax=Salininema proteolyticum TaxID=1607685 RepID=A0ABV8TX98_9ACTN